MNTEMLDFSGRVILITGGGGEIGAKTAELFGKQGATVVTTDVDFPKLDGSVDIEADTVKFALDVTDKRNVEEALVLYQLKSML